MPPEEWERWREKVKVIKENAFPYLDMQLSWRHDNLHFSVYSKENQTIKYVNNKSCHRILVFKVVPAGVFTRIVQLTLLTDENENTPITNLYSLHAAVLTKAKLMHWSIPT
eukprot:2062114-Ditylum_brightwellii.AAC.1